jgi:hypothetical protein
MKNHLFVEIETKIKNRIDTAKRAMQAAQAAANEESKSSVGDKYETGRAMAQIDRDMYARQLAEAQNDLALAENAKNATNTEQVGKGSLVETTIGYFLIAVSIGKVMYNNTAIMVVSPESPIGELLLRKKKNEKVVFRGKTIEILDIC